MEENRRNKNSNSLLCKAQALAEDIKEMESLDTGKAYRRAKERIKAQQKMLFYHRLMRYAAFLALPLLISSLVFGYLYFHEAAKEEMFAEVTAATGSVIRYELPDRSVVWLNAGSKLRYPTTFSTDNRQVELRGEAYFEVQADRKHPFYVNTPDGLTVYVYGTKFNVNAYSDENTVEAVLEKGKVHVMSPDGQTTVPLSPGERLVYNKKLHTLSKDKVDVYEKVAWKDGKLVFRDATLNEIFKRLERHFNVDIQFHNNSGKEYKYRATFRDETLPQILDYLAKSVALKWKTEEGVQQTDDTFTKKKIIVNLY